MRLTACSQAVLLVLASIACAQLAKHTPQHTEKSKIITVHEGTDMEAAVSPDGGTLLIDVQGMLYSMPVTGGKAKQVTGPLVEASHPSYSPKGDWVAIQSYQGGTFHIWLMHPDGTGMRQLTTGHGDDREPMFSPDGKTVAFSSDRAFRGSYDVWIGDVASGTLKQLTFGENDEFEPAWTPDSKVVYVSFPRKIVEIDPVTLEQKTIAEVNEGRIESPTVSSAGRLAYIHLRDNGHSLSASNLIIDGNAFSTKYDDAFPFPAAWMSPTSLIYTANGKIVKADLVAKSETEIPFAADIKVIRPVYRSKNFAFDSRLPKQALGIYGPSLSPDGKQVAFVALNQLYLLTVGNPVPKALTHDSFYKQGPMWSPNGQWLAYASDKGGIENVYLLNPKTGEERHPSPSVTTAQIFPAWSPDGKWIASQDQTGTTHLFDVATGRNSMLSPATFFPGRASFSSNGKTVALAIIHPYTKRFREGTSDIVTVDIATKKQTWHAPAPFESITTRTEDGPIYASNGKEMAFVMDDLLYTVPVDADGIPDGKAVALNHEVTDAPTYNHDGSKLLYLSNGRLRLIDRVTKSIMPVPLILTWKPEQPAGKILIHAGRLWKGMGPDEEKDVDILVVGHRIASITPTRAAQPLLMSG